MRPFSIKLFAPSGDPNGVLVASRDDWPGRAVIYPRALAAEVRTRKEYAQPGVYILVGNDKIYIGEGDPLGDRLNEHVKGKDFWSKAVFFTAEGGRLNKAHVQYLESKLVAYAKEFGRTLENVQTPGEPYLSEEDRAFSAGFFYEILMMLPLLGFHQFVKDKDDLEGLDDGDDAQGSELPDPVSGSPTGKRAEFYKALPQGAQFTLKTKGICARMELFEGGVRVKNGSQVVYPESQIFEVNSPAYAALRRQLVDSGILVLSNGSMTFSADQDFASGSAASSVIRGSHGNSEWWKDSNGKTLGDHIRDAKKKAGTA